MPFDAKNVIELFRSPAVSSNAIERAIRPGASFACMLAAVFHATAENRHSTLLCVVPQIAVSQPLPAQLLDVRRWYLPVDNV